MEHKRIEMDGYELYLINTNRFKTIEIKANIRIKNKKEYEVYIPLLWRILISTSSRYSSIKQINEKCAYIYDPYYSISSVISGSEDIISLTGTFTNERYTEEGMNEENINFITHFLFEPKVDNEMFDEDIFEIQKSKLIESYNSLKDHPRDYADGRLEEEMHFLNYKSYSIDELIKYTKELKNKDLYKFYQKLMNEGKLDIFVCGNFDNDEMKRIIGKNIKFKSVRDEDINHIIQQKDYNVEPNIIIENSNNIQSNLVIGCKVIDITEFERKYVFPLYSWILGGGMNSLLNRTVREENSLCYYIYAVRKNVVGVMKIFAGIDGENFEKTYDLIKKEMSNMEKGNFTKELFEGVKNLYYNSLISIEDYQEDMVSSFISEIYVNSDDIKIRKKMMEKVKIEDIINFSKKVHIDTVYLLKGDAR